MLRRSFFLALMTLAACGDDDGTPATDAGSRTDSGGTPDSGGGTDSSVPADSGADVDAATADSGGGETDAGPRSMLSFFITSTPRDGGNLGGLAGADAHCQSLAAAVGAGDRTWRAYLSASDGGDGTPVHARDRIGTGPWLNAAGTMIAADVAELHADNAISLENGLTEGGDRVPGRGETPNQHDILTGSTADGMLMAGQTCDDWTSNGGGSSARVGHHDKVGPCATCDSWNSAHNSAGCSMGDLVGTGGNGFFYCFAAD